MPKLPNASRNVIWTLRLNPYELDYMKYLASLEFLTHGAFIRKLIREYGEDKGISFYEFNKLGREEYHTQRQQLLMTQNRASQLNRRVQELEKEKELYGK